MGLPHPTDRYKAGAALGWSSSQREQNQGLGSAFQNQQFQTHSWAKAVARAGIYKNGCNNHAQAKCLGTTVLNNAMEG